jgi:phage/plasmid primase-like uncharacterized protein
MWQGGGKMRERPFDVALIKRMAAGHWLAILEGLAPELVPAIRRPGRHVPCPVHGGSDGFRLFPDANETGGGICNTCGPKSDGLALLQWLKGWSFPEAVAAVADAVSAGATLPPPTARVTQSRLARDKDQIVRQQRRARRALEAVWHKSVPLTAEEGAPGRLYLQKRGIEVIPASSRLRCHPGLGYYEERNGRSERIGKYPCLIARYTDNRDALLSLHRTYLSHDGSKASVMDPRKAMRFAGPVLGGCVRLSPADWEVGIAEGIETALAVQQRAEMPVWATLSATFLEHWIPPEGVRNVIIWADKDRSGRGQEAARTLKQRLEARGIAAQINLPPGFVPRGRKSIDWADPHRVWP